MLKRYSTRVWVVAVILGLSVPLGLRAASWLMPTRELHRHALVTLDGVQPRYQVSYLTDDLSPTTCVMVLTDTQTGVMTMTAIPSDSCDVRRAGP